MIVDDRGVVVEKRTAFIGAHERRHQFELLLDKGYTPQFHGDLVDSGVVGVTVELRATDACI